jgi:hypothetical protein
MIRSGQAMPEIRREIASIFPGQVLSGYDGECVGLGAPKGRD